MRNFFRNILFILFLFESFVSSAQLFIKGEPTAYTHNLNSVKATILSIDTFTIQKNSKSSVVLQPEQAGITVLLSDKIVADNGKWSKIDNYHYVWRIAFEVPSAKALNLYFRNFNLKMGYKLFLYSEDLKQQLGAFTKNNNNSYFATGLITANRLILELNTDRRLNQLPFDISELGVVMQNERGFGDAGSCEVPVNCNEGAEWQNQKQGVARVLVKQASSLFWCSGTLINNTANDGTPYFLTANHCGSGSTTSDYNQWIFDFSYESINCERPTIEPDKITLTGSQLIARGDTPRSIESDFKLLRLNEDIPDEYHFYFNGWDRSGDIPQRGVVIQHPQGDIKYIATYNEPAISSYYYGSENPDAPFWKVVWGETENGFGVTEGGSSGSPLFNEDRLIVGSLTGGGASCINNTAPDYFGKFSESWDQNGSAPADQLKPWLDPDNTGVSRLDGYFKGGNILEADFSSWTTKIISGSYLKFTNLSIGNINNYKWEFEGGEPSTSSKKEPELIFYRNTGTYSVKLIISSYGTSDTLIRKDYINVIGNIYPNPFVNGNGIHHQVHILTGDTPLESVEVYISDITGKLIQKINPKIGDHEITVNPDKLAAGTYIITTIIFDQKTSYKLVVVNTERE